MRMRRICYWLCMIAALLLLILSCLPALRQAEPAPFETLHQQGEIPEMRGFGPESIFNAGDVDALDDLPGLGETLSQRIVDMRTELGGYRLPEDLLLVQGIGEITLEEILEVLAEPLIVLPPLN